MANPQPQNTDLTKNPAYDDLLSIFEDIKELSDTAAAAQRNPEQRLEEIKGLKGQRKLIFKRIEETKPGEDVDALMRRLMNYTQRIQAAETRHSSDEKARQESMYQIHAKFYELGNNLLRKLNPMLAQSTVIAASGNGKKRDLNDLTAASQAAPESATATELAAIVTGSEGMIVDPRLTERPEQELARNMQ